MTVVGTKTSLKDQLTELSRRQWNVPPWYKLPNEFSNIDEDLVGMESTDEDVIRTLSVCHRSVRLTNALSFLYAEKQLSWDQERYAAITPRAENWARGYSATFHYPGLFVADITIGEPVSGEVARHVHTFSHTHGDTGFVSNEFLMAVALYDQLHAVLWNRNVRRVFLAGFNVESDECHLIPCLEVGDSGKFHLNYCWSTEQFSAGSVVPKVKIVKLLPLFD